MNDRGNFVDDAYPVSKRYSLLESPDTGERWPESFDAVTIEQQQGRHFKAKEARRNLDQLFEIPIHRRPDYLYGLILHYPDDENRGLVMFDTAHRYNHVEFDTMLIVGTKEYGYKPGGDKEILQGDLGYEITEGNLITYFKVPGEFEPIEGEVLGMIVAAARDELRPLKTD